MPRHSSITILGATGTIGKQTLDVITRQPARFSVFALTAKSRAEELHAQCLQHKPHYAVVLEAAAS